MIIKNFKADCRQGFTLLELAIVLIIIALIIGGVFTASTLRRASQLQTALSEYDSYVKAVGEFQDKYHALPGDMTGPAGYDPASIWGSPAVDGDGDGAIGTCDTNGNVSNASEWYQAWLQLADAGFIKGSFSGTGVSAVPGVNVPNSALAGAGWTLFYYLYPSNGAAEDATKLWRDNYGNVFTLGAQSNIVMSGGIMDSFEAFAVSFTNPANFTGYTSGPAMSNSEALAMDSKIDDGAPGTGKVRAWRTSKADTASCTTNDTSQTNQAYAVSANNKLNCSLVFIPGF